MDRSRRASPSSRIKAIGLAGAIIALCLVLVAIRLAGVGPHKVDTGAGDAASEMHDEHAGAEGVADHAASSQADGSSEPSNSQASDDQASLGKDGVQVVRELGGYVPEICQSRGELVAWASNGMGSRLTYRVEADLPTIAAQLLQLYQSDDSLELRHADYLDLFQNVWGCVLVTQSNTAIVAIVDERGGQSDEASCSVIIERIGPS